MSMNGTNKKPIDLDLVSPQPQVYTQYPQPSAAVPPPPQTPHGHVLPEPPGHKPSRAKDGLRSILSTLAILIIAPIMALLITAFVFQSYEVDGPSMESTLQDRDRLIVTKLGKTWSLLSRGQYIPHRGAIIVFKQNEGFDDGQGERQLIKRVIGLPGDRVVVKDGSITIFNAASPGGFNPDKNVSWSSIVGETSGPMIDVTVQPGEVFVCGDNRANSLDSRAFGPIKSSSIVGSLSFRILPIKKARHF